jgi:hypothetical protein
VKVVLRDFAFIATENGWKNFGFEGLQAVPACPSGTFRQGKVLGNKEDKLVFRSAVEENIGLCSSQHSVKLKLMEIVFRILICTSFESNRFSTVNTNPLKLFSEMTGVCSENQMKHINTLCGKCGFRNVKADGTCCVH